MPGGDASYLNICSPKYKDGWGKCSKVNITNAKLEGRSGIFKIPESNLGDGVKAWAVIVTDFDGIDSRLLHSQEIIGGG